MVCSYCQSDTQVINSRHQKRANQVWRRRKCNSCHAIFTTIERIEATQAYRVLHKGLMRPFSRELLLISVYESLKHRTNPAMDAADLTNTIVSLLFQAAEASVLTREQIVEITAAVLERFDTVAAVHYRAFHS